MDPWKKKSTRSLILALTSTLIFDVVGHPANGIPSVINVENNSKQFCGTGNSRMKGFTYQTHNLTFMECAQACYRDYKCDSFNFNKVPYSSLFNGSCELNTPVVIHPVSCALTTNDQSVWFSLNNCDATIRPSTCCNIGDERSCEMYARKGECQNNPTWMMRSCTRSCQASCGCPTGSPVQDNDCRCVSWAASGECEINPAWMNVNCAEACSNRNDSIPCPLDERPVFQGSVAEYEDSRNLPEFFRYPYTVTFKCAPGFTHEGSWESKGLMMCHQDGIWRSSNELIGTPPKCVRI